MKNVSELALQSKAWPFVEAKKLIKRIIDRHKLRKEYQQDLFQEV